MTRHCPVAFRLDVENIPEPGAGKVFHVRELSTGTPGWGACRQESAIARGIFLPAMRRAVQFFLSSSPNPEKGEWVAALPGCLAAT